MTQWHPLFAQLLRPVVENHYEVETNVPVGDIPREMDIVLLRRRSQGSLPFRGLWQHLTTWNILEFKGPTVSPRLRELDLLLEIGLGIDRRLNEERRKHRQRFVEPQEVSFWYLASRLGQRFVRDAARRLGPLEPFGSGMWRCSVLLWWIYLVSSVDLPVERDSVPLHLVDWESPAGLRAVAHVVVEDPASWRQYSGWLRTLYPEAWEEVETMARTARREPKIHLEPVVQDLGPQKALEEIARIGAALESDQQQVTLWPLIKRFGPNRFVESLTEAERQQLERELRRES